MRWRRRRRSTSIGSSWHTRADDAHYVSASRWFTVMWGLVAVGFALFASLAENLIQAVNIVASIFYGVVLGMFLVAFFLRRVHGTAVFWAAIAAQLLVFVLYASLEISYLWYNVIGCAACVGFSLACRLCSDPAIRVRRRRRIHDRHTPVICFGQQPCGFFPRRYLYAKIATARRLQSEIGGEVVFFCHDSDHDFRETRTTLRHRKTGEPIQLNFAFDNQVQRKFSPLYLKRVRADWHARTADQLRAYVDPRWVEAFRAVQAAHVADFCLEMYRSMGLLEGLRVARSSDPAFRLRGVRGRGLLCRCAVRGRGRAGSALRAAGSGCTREATSTWTSRIPRTPATGSARRAIRGCAGCNR